MAKTGSGKAKATAGKKNGGKNSAKDAGKNGTKDAGKNGGKNGGKDGGKDGGTDKAPSTTGGATSVTAGPGEVADEVTSPEPVVPAARTAPESRPLAVRHPRKPAPAPRHAATAADVTTTDVTTTDVTSDDVTSDDVTTDGSEPVGREAALPATSSTVDELARLAMVPVDVARRVLPEQRLPFYLGVGALAVVGVLEWPLAVGAGLAWEALRRRPAR